MQKSGAHKSDNRYSSYRTAEVATKTVTSWSNALDAPNEDQCGLFEVGAPTNDQRGPLDATLDQVESCDGSESGRPVSCIHGS